MKLLRDILEQAAKTGHEVVHHISPHDIDKFHPLTHFGSYKAARQVGTYVHRDEWQNEKHPGPEYRNRYHYKARLVNKGNTFHMKSDGQMDHTPDRLVRFLHREGVFNDAERDQHITHLNQLASKHKNDSTLEAKEYAAKAIRDKGIHTLSHKFLYNTTKLRYNGLSHSS
jgi:hypothetical protein